jgi:hypothetical protein
MVRCGNCGRRIPDDPNELDEVAPCRYCDALFCSAACAAEHEERGHPAETVPAADDEDERR